MAAATLTIYGHGETRQAELNPKGTIVGRGSRSDVVIESRDVSREHARIFQDLLGRWIVEDLGSSNGIFISGRRIDSCSVLPGEPVIIGAFTLTISRPLEQAIEPDPSLQATNIVVEDFETEIFCGKTRPETEPQRPCPKQLDEIANRLSELTHPSALYPLVCRYLAWAAKTVAAVLRVPPADIPMPKTPGIVACHFGGYPEDARPPLTHGSYPSHLAFRVSRRVLEATRSKGETVMAKSIYSSDTEITSTFVDEHSPRAVICAPLGRVGETVDLLYIDVPIENGAKTAPEQMRESVAALAAQVIRSRRNLILMRLKSQSSVLEHELSVARRILSELAHAIPQNLSGVDTAVYYKPVVWVGGDYCDLWLLGDGRLAFAVGKVSTTGLPAALAISNICAVLRTALSYSDDLASAVRRVNSSLIQDHPKGISATLLLGLFDPPKATLQYVNGGMPQPLIVQPPAAVRPLGQPDTSALTGADISPTTSVQTISRGGQMVVLTDGIIKTMSPKGEEFGLKRLTHLLRTADSRSARDTADSLAKALTDFQQAMAQQDDITLFVLVNGK